MWLKDSCCLLFSVFQNILLGRWEERKSGKEHGRIFRPEMVFMVSIYLLRLFCFIRSTSSEYGSSQARGQIGATTASLHHSHSNVESEPHLRPAPQLTAAIYFLWPATWSVLVLVLMFIEMSLVLSSFLFICLVSQEGNTWDSPYFRSTRLLGEKRPLIKKENQIASTGLVIAQLWCKSAYISVFITLQHITFFRYVNTFIH